MSNWAEIDSNNVVLRVLVGDNASDDEGKAFMESLGGTWIQTSYNNKFRGTFAGEGYTYNPIEDIFITPQPYPSWIREGSYWYPPVPYPTGSEVYVWDEETQTWNPVETPSE